MNQLHHDHQSHHIKDETRLYRMYTNITERSVEYTSYDALIKDINFGFYCTNMNYMSYK